MEKQISTYIRKHTFMLIFLIISAFLLLALGEYLLYRKTQELNRMVSKSMMQIKEGINDIEND